MFRNAQFAAGAAVLCLFLSTAFQAQSQGEWDAVGSALGKAGTLLDGGLYRVALPRTDLQVNLAGVRIAPSFALGS